MSRQIALCCDVLAETHFNRRSRGVHVLPAHHAEMLEAIRQAVRANYRQFSAPDGKVAGAFLRLPKECAAWYSSGIARASQNPADYLLRTDYDGQIRAFVRREVAAQPERQIADRNLSMWIVRAETALFDPDYLADRGLIHRMDGLLARAREDDQELFSIVILLDHPGEFSPFDPIRLTANMSGRTADMTDEALAGLSPAEQAEKFTLYRGWARAGYAYWSDINWVADPDDNLVDWIRKPWAPHNLVQSSYWPETGGEG